MYVHSSTDDSTPRLTQEREQQTNSDEDSDLDKTPLINFVPDLDRSPIIHFVPTATVRQQTQPNRPFTSVMHIHSSTDDSTPRLTKKENNKLTVTKTVTWTELLLYILYQLLLYDNRHDPSDYLQLRTVTNAYQEY